MADLEDKNLTDGTDEEEIDIDDPSVWEENDALAKQEGGDPESAAEESETGGEAEPDGASDSPAAQESADGEDGGAASGEVDASDAGEEAGAGAEDGDEPRRAEPEAAEADGALQAATDEHDVPLYVTRRGRRVPVKSYDFRRPIKLSKGFVRGLSIVGETYSKLLTLSLSNYLRVPVTVSATGVRQILFEEYTGQIPNPSCINILDMPPIKIPGILEIDLPTVFNMLEKLLGSHVMSQGMRREFSAIELRIARKVVTRMLRDLQDSMLRILETQVTLTGTEHNPDFTYIMNANDPCIVMDFMLEMADVEGPMHVCLSLAALDAQLGNEGASPYRDVRSDEERSRDQLRLRTTLDTTRSMLVAELAKVPFTIERLRELGVGDVVNLRKQVDEPLLLRVGGSPLYRARMGRYKRKTAVKITEILRTKG